MSFDEFDFNPYADALFARPSAFEGVARTLDLAGTLTEYNASMTEGQADALNAAADWNAVIYDLLMAAKELAARRSLKAG